MHNLLDKDLFTLEEDYVSLFIKDPEKYVKKALEMEYQQKIKNIIKVEKFGSLIENVDKILDKINSGLPDKIITEAQEIENIINLQKLDEKLNNEILNIKEQLNKYNSAVEILKYSFKERFFEKQIFNMDIFNSEKEYIKKYKEFYDEKKYFYNSPNSNK